MTKLLIKPIKIQESAEVKNYALSQILVAPSPKPGFLKTAIDLGARMAVFYVLWLIVSGVGVYLWRLLTCNC